MHAYAKMIKHKLDQTRYVPQEDTKEEFNNDNMENCHLELIEKAESECLPDLIDRIKSLTYVKDCYFPEKNRGPLGCPAIKNQDVFTVLLKRDFSIPHKLELFELLFKKGYAHFHVCFLGNNAKVFFSGKEGQKFLFEIWQRIIKDQKIADTCLAFWDFALDKGVDDALILRMADWFIEMQRSVGDIVLANDSVANYLKQYRPSLPNGQELIHAAAVNHLIALHFTGSLNCDEAVKPFFNKYSWGIFCCGSGMAEKIIAKFNAGNIEPAKDDLRREQEKLNKKLENFHLVFPQILQDADSIKIPILGYQATHA